MARQFALLASVLLPALLALACGNAGVPSQFTPAAGVTPVTTPANVREFLAQFVDETVIQEACTYREDLGQIDCGSFGRYGPNPPPAGEAIVCSVLSVENRPVAITCITHEPSQLLYYAVES